MKYLCILVFAAICCQSNGNEPLTINTYDLNLELGDEKFIGKLKLTLSDDNSETLILDVGSNLKITACKYSKTAENDNTADCDFKTESEGTVITMKNRKSKTIDVTYQGTYTPNGLHREKINNKCYYFSSFANGATKNVLPCKKTDNKPFTLRCVETRGISVNSNIESIKKGNNVRLEDIVFICGEFQKISEHESVDIQGIMKFPSTEKAADFSIEVLKKMNDALDTNEEVRNKKVRQYLFPSSTLRDINGKFFTTHSVNNYVIDDNMGALREQSLRMDLIQRLSQHWFGAGTTSDKWLNAGLSTFLAYYALDKLPADPKKSKKFRALEQLVVDQLQLRAFEADGFTSSQSLKSFNTITTTYDGILSDPILFSKGASIMRSLFTICGDEKFAAALKLYAKLSSSITVESFANSFKSCFASAEEGKSFLNQWHERSGYPVVHVESKNSTNGIFKLTQEIFGWMDGGDKKSWTVPITFKLSNGTIQQTWLTGDETNLNMNGKVDWIIFNVNYTGYYRVNYDMTTWKEIISLLEKNHMQIDPINRAQIIDDIFSFSRSVRNYTRPVPDYKMALKLFDYLKKENDYIPLKAAFNAIEFLDYSLAGSQVHKLFRDRVKVLLNDLYKSNPLNKIAAEHVNDLLTREVGSWSCKMGIEECVSLAKQYYENKTHDDNFMLPSNIEDIVYCTMVSNDVRNWDAAFLKLKLSILTSQTKDILTHLNTLGCTKDVNRVKKFIMWSQTSYPNYHLEVISSLFNGNPENIQTTLDMLKSNNKNIRLDVKQAEKIVQLSLRKLNMENAKSLTAFVTEVLPKDNQVRKETETILSAMNKWNQNKVPQLHEALTSGEGRAKPFAVIVTLCAIFPVFSYFLRY